MEINLNIKGLEGLEKALHALAGALSNQQGGQEQAATAEQSQQQTTEQQQAPSQQQAPVQQEQAQPQTVPVQQKQPQQPAQPEQPQPQQQEQTQQQVPTSTPTYDFNQLAVAATQLMDAGKQNDILNLLNNTFGVQALTQLPEDQYGTFATKLRELGAKI